jgi:hypothetical protein
MLILFRQSGLFVSDHAVTSILGHMPVASEAALMVWTCTIISTQTSSMNSKTTHIFSTMGCAQSRYRCYQNFSYQGDQQWCQQ